MPSLRSRIMVRHRSSVSAEAALRWPSAPAGRGGSRNGAARDVNHQRQPRSPDRLAVKVVDDDHIHQRVIRLEKLERIVRL